jgi:hypothetical protein
MLGRIQDSKIRRGQEVNGILCKKYKEIPAGTENICIRIPTIWSVRSELLQLQIRILITLINQSRRDI